MIHSIDGATLRTMLLNAAAAIEAQKQNINELNVFPVPDGDTGTNMTLTIMSAAKEVSSLYEMGDLDMTSLCKAVSSGSLRGARGNSQRWSLRFGRYWHKYFYRRSISGHRRWKK